MVLIGLMLVRNEDWVLRCTIPAAMEWVDKLVVLDHASTDETPLILEEMSSRFPGRMVIMEEHSQQWDEMDHRQRTLEVGRKLGGTHFAICDADEILRWDSIPRVRQHFELLIPSQVMRVPLFCMWRSPTAYRDDRSVWGRAKLTLGFANSSKLHWKDRDGYHHHNRCPAGAFGTLQEPFANRDMGGACHLQWVDWRRVQAKHAWYKMMERVRYDTDPGKLNKIYGQALDETHIQINKMPRQWTIGWEALFKEIRIGPPYWHAEECKRMLEEHGRAKFAGLDLFGVV